MTTRQEETLVADRLWAEYGRGHSPRTRDLLIHQFERLAFSIANRFRGRGVESDDLHQVAMMGLVKAVDRFDPSTCYRFATFATPTITGELRRHFRDHGSSVHVSRGVQELAQQVNRLRPQMTEELVRSPTPAELAMRLNVTEEQINDVLRLPDAQRPLSLDRQSEPDGDRPLVLGNQFGREDPALTNAADRLSVTQAVRDLPEPLREIMRMRYVEGASQREVSRRTGTSQMRVSRMERRALGLLKAHFAVS